MQETEVADAPEATAHSKHHRGLARGHISGLGSLAQSVGLIGTTASAGIITVPVFLTVGRVGWLTWLIGTLALACVGYGISILASRFLTTGGLYPLAARAGGRAAGYFTSFGALWWLIVAAPVVALSAGIFVTDFLALPAFGVHQTTLLVAILSLVCALVEAWIAYAGIKISVRVLLGIEATTASLIMVLMLIVLITHHGGVIDHSQFHIGQAGIATLISGVVLIVFSLGGFESATVLGQEAHEGRKSIPVAVVGSIIVSGVFLAIVQYVTLLAFQGSNLNLAASANPLGDAAKIAGIGWYEYILNLVLVFAAVSNGIALFNAGGRMLFTLPREGLSVFGWLLRTSRKHKTPVAGILAFVVFDVIALVILALNNGDILVAWGNLGTLSGYGTVVMYGVTLIAVIVFLWRSTIPNVWGYGASVLGIAIMVYGLYKDFNPFPAAPVNLYAWSFIAGAAVAVAAYFLVVRRRKDLFSGASVDEDSVTTAPEGVATGADVSPTPSLEAPVT